MVPDVALYHSNYETQIFQIETGFKILNDLGIIHLKAIRTNESTFKRKTLPVIKVEVNGKKIIYDTIDGYRFDQSMTVEENLTLLDDVLNECDFYFKRSYSPELVARLKNKNIYPLGLNYPIYDFLFRDILEHKIFSKAFIRSILKYNRILAKALNIEYYKDLFPQNLCNPPLDLDDFQYPGSILFLARTWDPYSEPLPDDLIQERININETRAQCIRECKDTYGDLFLGGFYDSEFSRTKYPDLIVPKTISGKSSYLMLMKKASVCIATTGLHNSIGWKFGEYVACSKAIISEKLHYYIDDTFNEGTNYISVDNIAAVPAIIRKLLNNPAGIRQMMNNNHQYYNNYLRPDMLILNSLKKVLDIK